MNALKKRFALLLALCLALSLLSGCGGGGQTTAPAEPEQATEEPAPAEEAAPTEEAAPAEEAAPTEEAAPAEEPAAVEKNGDIYILFTSDVHCGVDQGFGYAGLAQVRAQLEAQGYEVLLVDDGDAIQGEPIGTLSKGESIIDLMNALHYDVAIPGNHEFDYTVEGFLALTEKAEFPYISCNFTKNGELVFPSYVIKEVAGKKIAFVGVTTPQTLISSTPKYFQDDEGNYIYGFTQDESGEALYAAVQTAVDAARAEGADYVYVMAHLGMEEECRPWTYADVLSHTNGIDVLLDGHQHDTEQVVMKNKDGEDVVRSACGTKLHCIGYSHISAEDGSVDTGIWSWPNDDSAVTLLGIDNEVGKAVAAEQAELAELLDKVVATSQVDLTIYDPEAVDASGNPVRMVRRAETNLGDLCADAYRDQGEADIAFVNGGGVRTNIDKGDITYGDILKVHPFGNEMCVIEVTGQQVLDALEWGARAVPEESGGFLQVSGLTYEIHTYIPTPCIADENSMCTGISGERRVKNVLVDGEPIDPAATYTLASHNYMLFDNGDGYTFFEGAPVLQDSVKLDNQVLMDYIMDTLGGTVSTDYGELTGQGRIVIVEQAP